MNTTLKGDIFEKRVFDLISDLLTNEEYFLSGKNSLIFSKKKYYSEQRKDYIICDISIESYMPNSKDYSFVNIIECKHLNKNVGVEDIEEFDSKLTQIGKHNSKGLIVSNIGFAKNTINIAKSMKIGLLKVKSDNQLDWINYRKESTNSIVFERDETEPFLALINNKTYNNIADLILKLGVIDIYKHKEKYLKIPFVTEEWIEKIIDRMYAYDIHDNSKLNTEKLCAFIESKYSATFDFSQSESQILGKIEFNPLKIYVNSELEENRFRFTLCHEIGHLILHSKLLKDRIEKKEDDDFTLSLNYNVSEINNRRLEIQANIFASNLLLPTRHFMLEVSKFFIKENIYKNYLYLDKQPVNQILVHNLLNQLSLKFNASKESIKMKLISKKLLKDTTYFSFKKLLNDLK